MLSLKSAIATMVVPGFGCLLVPFYILRASGISLTPPIRFVQVISVPIFVLGLYMVAWVSIAFVRIGRGTPIPINPPTRLVRMGLYQMVRNPMYVGALLMLLSEGIFFGSLWVLLYAAGLWGAFQAFLVLLEEPQLSRRFGSEYETYRNTVPRWIPRLRR